MEKANHLHKGVHGGAQSARFLFISCIILLTVVYMAVPRVANQGAAYFAKQVYYNHGADRGPHLGQRARMTNLGSQTNSRRLLEYQQPPVNSQSWP